MEGLDVNVNGSGGFKNKTEIVGSEVEKEGNADAWARRPYRKKEGVRGFSYVKVNVNGG